jgi:hypothetical protein
VRHPHWHGATVTDRLWYVVGCFYGIAISLGFLLLFDFQAIHRWWERVRHGEPGLSRNPFVMPKVRPQVRSG